jgi:hypothetical protein
MNKLLKHNDSDIEFIYNLITGYDKDVAQLQKALRSVCKIVVLR